jgi:DNA-binding transcriptional MerR regulator
MTKPLTTKQFADAVGVSVQTLRRFESRGLVRAVRDFRGWRKFPRSEVDRVRNLLGWQATDGGNEPGEHRRSPDEGRNE